MSDPMSPEQAAQYRGERLRGSAGCARHVLILAGIVMVFAGIAVSANGCSAISREPRRELVVHAGTR